MKYDSTDIDVLNSIHHIQQENEQLQQSIKPVLMEIDRNKKQIKELSEVLLKIMQSTETVVVGSAEARATIKTKTVGNVKDFEALIAHVHETGATELIRKQVNVTAYRERLEHGEDVPGVEPVHIPEITVKAYYEKV